MLAAILAGAHAADLNTARIDELTGLKGKMNAQEGVYKVTFPRDDVKISVAGWQMPAFMGLGTWAAFQGTNEKAMVMGDTVLLEDEVNSAMSAALDNGLSVTALHNHFFFDQPKVYFMHIGGEGSVEKLAAAVKKALRFFRKPPQSISFPEGRFQSIPQAPMRGAEQSLTKDPVTSGR